MSTGILKTSNLLFLGLRLAVCLDGIRCQPGPRCDLVHQKCNEGMTVNVLPHRVRQKLSECSVDDILCHLQENPDVMNCQRTFERCISIVVPSAFIESVFASSTTSTTTTEVPEVEHPELNAVAVLMGLANVTSGSDGSGVNMEVVNNLTSSVLSAIEETTGFELSPITDNVTIQELLESNLTLPIFHDIVILLNETDHSNGMIQVNGTQLGFGLSNATILFDPSTLSVGDNTTNIDSELAQTLRDKISAAIGQFAHVCDGQKCAANNQSKPQPSKPTTDNDNSNNIVPMPNLDSVITLPTSLDIQVQLAICLKGVECEDAISCSRAQTACLGEENYNKYNATERIRLSECIIDNFLCRLNSTLAEEQSICMHNLEDCVMTMMFDLFNPSLDYEFQNEAGQPVSVDDIISLVAEDISTLVVENGIEDPEGNIVISGVNEQFSDDGSVTVTQDDTDQSSITVASSTPIIQFDDTVKTVVVNVAKEELENQPPEVKKQITKGRIEEALRQLVLQSLDEPGSSSSTTTTIRPSTTTVTFSGIQGGSQKVANGGTVTQAPTSATSTATGSLSPTGTSPLAESQSEKPDMPPSNVIAEAIADGLNTVIEEGEGEAIPEMAHVTLTVDEEAKDEVKVQANLITNPDGSGNEVDVSVIVQGSPESRTEIDLPITVDETHSMVDKEDIMDELMEMLHEVPGMSKPTTASKTSPTPMNAPDEIADKVVDSIAEITEQEENPKPTKATVSIAVDDTAVEVKVETEVKTTDSGDDKEVQVQVQVPGRKPSETIFEIPLVALDSSEQFDEDSVKDAVKEEVEGVLQVAKLEEVADLVIDSIVGEAANDVDQEPPEVAHVSVNVDPVAEEPKVTNAAVTTNPQTSKSEAEVTVQVPGEEETAATIDIDLNKPLDEIKDDLKDGLQSVPGVVSQEKDSKVNEVTKEVVKSIDEAVKSEGDDEKPPTAHVEIEVDSNANDVSVSTKISKDPETQEANAEVQVKVPGSSDSTSSVDIDIKDKSDSEIKDVLDETLQKVPGLKKPSKPDKEAKEDLDAIANEVAEGVSEAVDSKDDKDSHSGPGPVVAHVVVKEDDTAEDVEIKTQVKTNPETEDLEVEVSIQVPAEPDQPKITTSVNVDIGGKDQGEIKDAVKEAISGLPVLDNVDVPKQDSTVKEVTKEVVKSIDEVIKSEGESQKPESAHVSVKVDTEADDITVTSSITKDPQTQGTTADVQVKVPGTPESTSTIDIDLKDKTGSDIKEALEGTLEKVPGLKTPQKEPSEVQGSNTDKIADKVADGISEVVVESTGSGLRPEPEVAHVVVETDDSADKLKIKTQVTKNPDTDELEVDVSIQVPAEPEKPKLTTSVNVDIGGKDKEGIKDAVQDSLANLPVLEEVVVEDESKTGATTSKEVAGEVIDSIDKEAEKEGISTPENVHITVEVNEDASKPEIETSIIPDSSSEDSQAEVVVKVPGKPTSTSSVDVKLDSETKEKAKDTLQETLDKIPGLVPSKATKPNELDQKAEEQLDKVAEEVIGGIVNDVDTTGEEEEPEVARVSIETDDSVSSVQVKSEATTNPDTEQTELKVNIKVPGEDPKVKTTLDIDIRDKTTDEVKNAVKETLSQVPSIKDHLDKDSQSSEKDQAQNVASQIVDSIDKATSEEQAPKPEVAHVTVETSDDVEGTDDGDVVQVETTLKQGDSGTEAEVQVKIPGDTKTTTNVDINLGDKSSNEVKEVIQDTLQNVVPGLQDKTKPKPNPEAVKEKVEKVSADVTDGIANVVSKADPEKQPEVVHVSVTVDPKVDHVNVKAEAIDVPGQEEPEVKVSIDVPGEPEVSTAVDVEIGGKTKDEVKDAVQETLSKVPSLVNQLEQEQHDNEGNMVDQVAEMIMDGIEAGSEGEDVPSTAHISVTVDESANEIQVETETITNPQTADTEADIKVVVPGTTEAGATIDLDLKNKSPDEVRDEIKETLTEMTGLVSGEEEVSPSANDKSDQVAEQIVESIDTATKEYAQDQPKVAHVSVTVKKEQPLEDKAADEPVVKTEVKTNPQTGQTEAEVQVEVSGSSQSSTTIDVELEDKSKEQVKNEIKGSLDNIAGFNEPRSLAEEIVVSIETALKDQSQNENIPKTAKVSVKVDNDANEVRVETKVRPEVDIAQVSVLVPAKGNPESTNNFDVSLTNEDSSPVQKEVLTVKIEEELEKLDQEDLGNDTKENSKVQEVAQKVTESLETSGTGQALPPKAVVTVKTDTTSTDIQVQTDIDNSREEASVQVKVPGSEDTATTFEIPLKQSDGQILDKDTIEESLKEELELIPSFGIADNEETLADEPSDGDFVMTIDEFGITISTLPDRQGSSTTGSGESGQGSGNVDTTPDPSTMTDIMSIPEFGFTIGAPLGTTTTTSTTTSSDASTVSITSTTTDSSSTRSSGTASQIILLDFSP